MRRPPIPVILIALIAFLAPLIGGMLANDATPLEPGFGPTIQSLINGFELGTLQHALIALLVAVLMVYLLVRRKVIQIPQMWVLTPIAIFSGLLVTSLLVSRYRWTSETMLAEWLIYVTALIGTVAGLGRKSGPVIVLSALVAGCGITATLGLLEYSTHKAANDPSWRIFSTWNNPNALAGMMVIGFLLSLGLTTALKDRLGKLLSGSAAVLTGVALILTGAKGGLVAVLLGLIVFVLITAAWRQIRSLAPAVVCVILVALIGYGYQKSANTPGQSGLRIASMGESEDQSVGFRKQLWIGAAQLIKETPTGYGLGAYANYSAKAGNTTRTELAHSTWIQLAVEATPLAPLVLLFALFAWLFQTMRSARSLPDQQNRLRAAVVATVVAVGANGLIESNFYFFGIGLIFFVLLGVGLQLSADAGAPEFVAFPMRLAGAIVGVLCVGQLLVAGIIGKMQANLRYLIHSGGPAEARELSATLRSISPFAGETWYRSAFTTQGPEQLEYLKRACEAAPSPRNFRSLAKDQELAGDTMSAKKSLEQALKLDPNNLSTLKQQMDLEVADKDEDVAMETARRIVAVERTPYFQIRSLPDLIPTETLSARVYLADHTQDVKAKIKLLREAVEGFKNYTKLTVPYARRLLAAEVFSGPPAQEVADALTEAVATDGKLTDLYRSVGDKTGVAWAEDAAGLFANPPVPK